MTHALRNKRLLSHTEISTAMTCWAQWDFGYGGRLAGSTLKSKDVPEHLRAGRAWGAAVAMFHAHAGTLLAKWEAHSALDQAVDKDVAKMIEAGLPPDFDKVRELKDRLGQMLDHYMATTEPLPSLTRVEDEFLVGIPSKTGKRASSRYSFLAYIDGSSEGIMAYPGQWIVEFKLRGSLTDPALIVKQRQHRYYAWAWKRLTGTTPSGVLVDERLNEVPKPPKINQNGKPSTDKRQITTPELYLEACSAAGADPDPDMLIHLGQRRWQQRVPIIFRPDELDEAGRELVSAAQLVRQLDSGELYPIRNATRQNCNYCDFAEICTEPEDELYVDSLFNRGVPKRDRDPEERTFRK